MVEIAEFLNESNMLEKYRIMYNIYIYIYMKVSCRRLCDGVPARSNQLPY